MREALSIGGRVVRPDLNLILGPDGGVQVEPKSMDVLVHLADRPGEVVPRQELLETVWAGVHVGDEAVSHCVWELRRAFRDDAREPAFIQTVVRRGYRLVAAVERSSSGTDAVLRALVALEPLVAPEGGGPVETLRVEHGGARVERPDGPSIAFERPVQAVAFALACQQASASAAAEAGPALPRVGIHLAEIVLAAADEGADAELSNPRPAVLARRLARLAAEGQILMSRGAFDLAVAAAAELSVPWGELRWSAHGGFLVEGFPRVVEVFEVRRREASTPPIRESDEARRAPADATVVGWRAAPGVELPGRANWRLERRLGEGGYGEAWLGRREKTGELRVFKLCYDERALWALKREVTVFRLLKEVLGERPDIAAILDWRFESAPYFLESEYTVGGSVLEWADIHGGLPEVPYAKRLEIVAQAAEALGAAHSVGVLHKDLKPANLLVAMGSGGEPQVRLTDFGISQLTDAGALDAAGITRMGMTETRELSSSDSGTRLYMAPELLEGRAASVQSDLYALGVFLYQMVVGDTSRALAAGWERDVEDEVLREDLARLVDRSPARRPEGALVVARGLRDLDARRRQRHRQARARRRRRWVAALAGAAVVVGATAAFHFHRVGVEAATSQRVADFLVGLLQEADPYQSELAELTARGLVDRARRLEPELEKRPELQARVSAAIGAAYTTLGDLPEARGVLESALSKHQTRLGPDHLTVATLASKLGALRAAEGEYQAAHGLMERALVVREGRLGPGDTQVARSLNDLAVIDNQLSEWAAAEGRLRRAVAIYRASPAAEDLALDLAAALDNLGYALDRQERRDEAVAAHEESLELRRDRLPPDHLQILTSLNNLALIRKSGGDLAGAASVFRELEPLLASQLGPANPSTLICRFNLASTLLEKGEPEEAGRIAEEVLELHRERPEPDLTQIARSMTLLARSLHAQGRLDAAIDLHRQAYEQMLQLHGRISWQVVRSLEPLGAALIDRGDFEEAAERLREVLEIRLQGPDGERHWSVAEARLALADAEWRAGRPEVSAGLIDEALQLLREAYPDRRRAIARGERLLGHLQKEREG